MVTVSTLPEGDVGTGAAAAGATGAAAAGAGRKARKPRTIKALLALKLIDGDTPARTFAEVDIGNTGVAEKAKTALDKVANVAEDYLVYRYVGTYRRTEKTRSNSSLK